MAWMRVVAGRLEMRYRYSKEIVYNTFPWCNPTNEQKAKIESTAQSILDARAKYTDCSLSVLYDENTMPADLRKAHEANDRAVLAAYGWSKDLQESEIVERLFGLYEAMVKGK
ncbi:MAG: methylase [Salinivirgaceae bacterium]|nr:methylase [Salinivirgaceae bacterium]